MDEHDGYPVVRELPFVVSYSSSFLAVDRDYSPTLTSLIIEADVTLAWRQLRSLLYRRVSLPRPIGFTAKWFIEGDGWKATW